MLDFLGGFVLMFVCPVAIATMCILLIAALFYFPKHDEMQTHRQKKCVEKSAYWLYVGLSGFWILFFHSLSLRQSTQVDFPTLLIIFGSALICLCAIYKAVSVFPKI